MKGFYMKVLEPEEVEEYRMMRHGYYPSVLRITLEPGDKVGDLALCEAALCDRKGNDYALWVPSDEFDKALIKEMSAVMKYFKSLKKSKSPKPEKSKPRKPALSKKKK